MPVPPAPLPNSLRYPVFSLEEAERLGVPRNRLRRQDVVPVLRGMYRRRSEAITERDIIAALCRNDPTVFAVGLSAARLWGFPLPGVLSKDVVVPSRAVRRRTGSASYRSPRRGPERRIHLGTTAAPRRSTGLLRWSRVDIDAPLLAKSGSVPLTPRITTFLGLGEMLTRDPLVAIGDHLVRRPRWEYEHRSAPYATIPELMQAAQTGAGRGIARVREAVTHVRSSSDSPPETTLRLAFARAGLPEPLANVRIRDQGKDLGEPDLHWPQWQVIVEYDGPTHLQPGQRRRDNSRQETRTLAGWIELSMVAEDLADGCRQAIDRVREALRVTGWPG